MNGYRSKKCLYIPTVPVILLGLSACLELPEQVPFPTPPAFDTGSASDSETEVSPSQSIEQSVMPNPDGFYFSESGRLHLQGSWYWYDSLEGELSQVYIDVGNELYDWFGGPKQWDEDEETTRNTKVTEICAKGTIGGQDSSIALGFELCSPREQDLIHEFPYPLGTCELVGIGFTYADQKFQEISLTVEGNISLLKVQFKEWAAADESQPYCIIDVSRTDTKGDSKQVCSWTKTTDDDVSPPIYEVTAKINQAYTDEDDLLDVGMLQAIHFELLGSTNEKPSFCLRDVYAHGIDASTERTPDINVDTNCPDRQIAPAPDYDAGWISPVEVIDGREWDDASAWPDGDPFQIMREEVSVRAYRDCQTAGACNGDVRNWKSCTVHLDEVTEEDLSDLAANCVNWCEADNFCRWVGGELPTEAQWKFAAWGGRDEEDRDNDEYYPWGTYTPTCRRAVMNDESGVACGDDNRRPAAGCTIEEGNSPSGICDMSGNLWEWVADEYNDSPDEKHQWQKGYRMIKGGSLNSRAPEALRIEEKSLEHPVKPHSPTRVGFRCIRYL